MRVESVVLSSIANASDHSSAQHTATPMDEGQGAPPTASPSPSLAPTNAPRPHRALVEIIKAHASRPEVLTDLLPGIILWSNYLLCQISWRRPCVWMS